MTLMTQEGGWSAEHSFVSVPAVGPNSSLSMLAIADMGQAEADGTNENGYGQQHPSLATLRGLMQHAKGRRLLLHNGDISYARSEECTRILLSDATRSSSRGGLVLTPTTLGASAIFPLWRASRVCWVYAQRQQHVPFLVAYEASDVVGHVPADLQGVRRAMGGIC
jgi:hypothetical protein